MIQSGAGASQQNSAQGGRDSIDTANVYRIIRAFHSHGHLMADIDPLRLRHHYSNNETLVKKFRIPEEKLKKLMDFRNYGLTDADLDRTFTVDLKHSGAILAQKSDWKLSELLEKYNNAYCGKIGVEFMHLSNREEQNWIRNKFE